MNTSAYPAQYAQNSARSHNIVIGYLAWLFGVFGAHRFYFGKPLTGILWFLTGGLLLIGWIVDFFLIPSMEEEAGYRFATGHCDYTVAWLLLALTGVFGIHRFYMGKWITGIIYLLSGGLFFVGVIYDILTLNDQIHEINVRP